MHEGYKQGFLVRLLVSMLAQPLPSLVVLGKLLDPLVSQFPHL